MNTKRSMERATEQNIPAIQSIQTLASATGFLARLAKGAFAVGAANWNRGLGASVDPGAAEAKAGEAKLSELGEELLDVKEPEDAPGVELLGVE